MCVAKTFVDCTCGVARNVSADFADLHIQRDHNVAPDVGFYWGT